MKQDIKNLVDFALTSTTNKKKEVEIGIVSKQQAAYIQSITGINFTGSPRVIDNYMVRHAIQRHGSQSIEAKHGQIAINLDDFLRLPEVFSTPDSIEHIGKNSLGQDLFKYTKRLNELVFVIEAARVASKGNKLVFTTMYKRK